MKEYVLSYYPSFKCIAGKCKHTCCAGWEINIDNQSLSKYKECEGEFLSALKKGINFRKSKFITDKSKKCAFLNEEGLCDIIINLGEKNLCQVCRDHPRFRSFFDDRIEMGLGFCCEEASRIILSYEGKIEPMLVSDNKEGVELNFNQKNVLEFRTKIRDVLQDRSVDINDRINMILKMCNAQITERDLNKILKTFLSLEKVDKNWTKRLKSINNPINQTTDSNLSHYCEQFLVNSIYRHLSDAEDTMWVRARTIFCIISWWIVNSVIKSEKDEKQSFLDLVTDVVRAYSAEVEYSKKNLIRLYSLCYRYIKI